MQAAVGGSIAIVQLLLEHGANPVQEAQVSS